MAPLLSQHQETFRKLAIAHIQKSGRSIEILAIAGPNGGGKTTLIRALLQKFPKIFTEVVQVSTRPPRENDRARRFVPASMFTKEKIVVGGIAGLYAYGYALADLMEAIRRNKIILFEGIPRLEKIETLLGKKNIKSMIAGVLPPGENIREMLEELEKRLIKRTGVSHDDVQKKLIDAATRIIPNVMQKAHIVVRSTRNNTSSDITKIMKKWKAMAGK